MKIVHIITHLELGGAQKTTLNMVRALKKFGYEVALLSSRQGLLYQEVKKEFGKEFKVVWSLRREVNPIYDLISFFKIYFYLKKNKFDIVHTHSSKAGILGRWAAKLAGVKKIFHTIHGFSFNDYQFFLLKRLYIFLEMVTARITNKLIAVAPEIERKGLKNDIGKPLQYKVVPEIVVIPSLEKEYNENLNGKFKIGMVACLKPQKAPMDFLKSAEIVLKKQNNIEFFLVGDGPLKRKLENSIKDCNISDRFKLLGWRRDAYNLMKEWDIIILTSLWEGLPHVIIEAMSLGKAIIATKVDGIKDVIEDGINGAFVPPKSPKQLAEKISLFLKNDKLRKRVSLNAYHGYWDSGRFNFQENMKKIRDIYLKC